MIGNVCNDSWSPLTVGTLTALAPSNIFLVPLLFPAILRTTQVKSLNIHFFNWHYVIQENITNNFVVHEYVTHDYASDQVWIEECLSFSLLAYC